MSRLDLGVSPNTLALSAGLGLMAVVCSNFIHGLSTSKRMVGWSGLTFCAIILAATQSRSACLGLLLVSGVWFSFYRKQQWMCILASCALMLVWLALAGRVASSALTIGASVRQWVHGAAIMQGGEALFATPTRVGGLAEDAAMRFGFPLGVEQGRMIKGPLSTLLAWLDPLLWPFGLLGWAGLAAPACIWPRRDVALAGGWSLWVPSAALFTVVCAFFNCLHQDRLGCWLLPLLALAGWIFLASLVCRRRYGAAVMGVAGAVVGAGVLLVMGYFLLRQNFRQQGIAGWQISRSEAGASGGGEILSVSTSAEPRGTVILFDHSRDSLASWNCRRALFRRVADDNWKLLWVPGLGTEATRLEQVGIVRPVVVVGLGGPVPESDARNLAPNALVHIDAGLVVWLTPDGASATTPRHWVATRASVEDELDRAVIFAKADERNPPKCHLIPVADAAAWVEFWIQLVNAHVAKTTKLL